MKKYEVLFLRNNETRWILANYLAVCGNQIRFIQTDEQGGRLVAALDTRNVIFVKEADE